jgi:hypothetical protein
MKLFILLQEAPSFAQKWRIPDKAVANHIELACGYRNFPVMMLLINPSPDHELLSFNEMVQKSSTLKWLREILQQKSRPMEAGRRAASAMYFGRAAARICQFRCLSSNAAINFGWG